MNDPITRRRLLLAAAAAGTASLAACANRPSAAEMPPIVFVPGNGDTAALWMTTIWRFESNGWPRDRLYAIDMPYPLARDDDAKEQPGRSSTAQHMAYLAAEVRKVLAATGASKVALVGNSRGGYPIRNFIANGGGSALVSYAVLGGVPNHGVWANAAFLPGSEFNGAGPFLVGLNTPRADGTEVAPGVAWMTIRSDNNDKFAQPDGVWIGARGTPTNITFDGPALKGAENVVIAGIDHRETSFSAKAFAETYRFIAGRPPTTLAIVPEARVVLDGTVSGLGLDNRQGNFATNLALAGVTVEVHALDAATGERKGAADAPQDDRQRRPLGPVRHRRHHAPRVRHRRRGLCDDAHLPLALSALVVGREPASRTAGRRRSRRRALVVCSRPRGYFGVPRDRIVLDGTSPPSGIPSGVAGVSTARVKIGEPIGAPCSASSTTSVSSAAPGRWRTTTSSSSS